MSVSLGIASRENFKRKYGRPQSEREHGINLNASTREKVWYFWWKEEVRLFFTIKQRTKGGRVILNLSTTVYLEWDVENPCFFSHKSWWFVLTNECSGSRSNASCRNSLRWPIYVINSVGNTGSVYPAILSHRRSTTVSLETYPLQFITSDRQIWKTKKREPDLLFAGMIAANWSRPSILTKSCRNFSLYYQ